MKVSLTFAALVAATGSGCLDGSTTGDTTQGEINRQNGVADKVQSQYARMRGQFFGRYRSSAVLLSLDVARLNSTGNGDLSLVPQPTLVGTLSLTPRIFVTDSGQALSIPFAVTGGQYVNGNDLTLTVQQNGSPTVLHCKVPDVDHLDCSWYVNASTAPKVQLSLVRGVPAQAADEGDREKIDGKYAGANSDYSRITAEFRTFLEPQATPANGSVGLPQVSIIGSFLFAPRPTAEQTRLGQDPGSANFPFTDGEYDPISDTLALRINGINMSSPIEVNCAIRSATALHCSWVGAHGSDYYEDFELSKVN